MPWERSLWRGVIIGVPPRAVKAPERLIGAPARQIVDFSRVLAPSRGWERYQLWPVRNRAVTSHAPRLTPNANPHTPTPTPDAARSHTPTPTIR